METRTRKPMVTGWMRVAVIALVVLAVLVGVGVWARSTSGATAPPQPGAMMRTNEDGQITIKATWQGRNAGPMFVVEMDTHVVNLDGYDLKQLAALRTVQGQAIQPVSWDAPSGGHHRSGTLTFPATLADGTPLLGPDTHRLELIIRNVGGIPERIFRWTL